MNGSMCLIGFQVSRPSIEGGGVALLERRVAVRVLVRDDREQQHRREQQEVLKMQRRLSERGESAPESRQGRGIGAKGSDRPRSVKALSLP